MDKSGPPHALGFAFLVLLFTLPETSSANILYRRAQRLRAKRKPKLRTKGEILLPASHGQRVGPHDVCSTFHPLFPRTDCFGYQLPHWSRLRYSLPLVRMLPDRLCPDVRLQFGRNGTRIYGIFVGAVIHLFPLLLWHKYSYEPLYDKQNGKVAPEKWLEPAILGAWAIRCACLVLDGRRMLAFTGLYPLSFRPSSRWYVFVVPISGWLIWAIVIRSTSQVFMQVTISSVPRLVPLSPSSAGRCLTTCKRTVPRPSQWRGVAL